MLVKIKDICNITMGQSPESKYYSNTNGFPFLQGNKTFGLKYPFIDTYTTKITKKAKVDSILISVRAPVGDLNIANQEICIGRGIASLEAIDGDNEFLYYALKSNMNNILNKGNGTTYDSITVDALKEIEINIPNNKQSREKISKILSGIDNQIERNNAMTKRLQVLAQTTYSRWFNQFEYPNNNEKKVFNKQLNKEIPTSFTVKSLGDIIVESKKSTIQVGEARLENGNYPFFTSGAEILPYKDYFVDGAYCFLNTGGNADVKFYEGKSAYSTDTWCLSANEYSYWLYLYLESIKSNMDQLFFSGSGLKHLQKDVFKKQVICLPNKELIEQFNLIVSKLFKYQSKIIQENKELVALKDRLLPLLINGQLNI